MLNHLSKGFGLLITLFQAIACVKLPLTPTKQYYFVYPIIFLVYSFVNIVCVDLNCLYSCDLCIAFMLLKISILFACFVFWSDFISYQHI